MPYRGGRHGPRQYGGAGYGRGRTPAFIAKGGALGCCSIALIVVGIFAIFIGGALLVIGVVHSPKPYERPKPGDAFDDPFFDSVHTRREEQQRSSAALFR